METRRNENSIGRKIRQRKEFLKGVRSEKGLSSFFINSLAVFVVVAVILIVIVIAVVVFFVVIFVVIYLITIAIIVDILS